tara:strand:+ start:918 stop:1970 length:1053 start_codon:yes stop_codon:yes gene_type:complete
MRIDIKKFQLLEICNIKFKVYHPIDKFVNFKEFKDISKYQIYKKKFFPIPIYFNIEEKIYKNKIIPIQIYFKNIKVCTFRNYTKFKINKKNKMNLFPYIFKTNDIYHPGVKKFLEEGEFFISSKIYNFNEEILSLINFSKPEEIKKIFFKNGISNIAGFHTRNIPHRGHEWIHRYGLKQCGALLIQPIIGMYKKGEFKEKYILSLNKLLINKVYKNKNVFFSVLNSFPRYAGPKEALLHALIRKNYGCSHFIVGRDHAGISNYYKKYESQNICKINEKNLGIKIITFNEPKICNCCNKVSSSKCKKCKKNKMLSISGTKVRNLILNNFKIPSKIMRPIISEKINKNYILK